MARRYRRLQTQFRCSTPVRQPSVDDVVISLPWDDLESAFLHIAVTFRAPFHLHDQASLRDVAEVRELLTHENSVASDASKQSFHRGIRSMGGDQSGRRRSPIRHPRVIRCHNPCHSRKSLLCKGVIGVIRCHSRVIVVSLYYTKVSSVSHIFHTYSSRVIEKYIAR